MEKDKIKTYEKLMRKCFALAKKGIGKVEPNPYVGAIIYDEEKDIIISKGYHQKFGFEHAEVNAINNAKGNIKGKTLIVNLEPCSHYGKTPPCADLIIKSGIKKVIVAMVDCNDKVKGRGIKKLNDAGIETIVGILEKEAKELNKVFIKNITTSMPYVMLKSAVTLDGKIALIDENNNQKSKWITDEFSRNSVQKLRSSYQAIISATGTILKDNPKLNVRIKNKKSPIRIIFDTHDKIPFNYNVFNDDVKVIWINNSNKKPPIHVTKISFEGNLTELFKKLYEMKIYSIMVEAGQKFNTLLLKNNIVDEINIFMAPKLFGKGLCFIDELSIDEIKNCIHLKDLKIKKLKEDFLINAKIKK